MEDPGRSSCSIPALKSSEKEVNIYLKIIKTVALKVKISDTIGNLKAKLREKEGVSECLQELYYSGERLEDNLKLVDCGIQKNSTLHLFLRNLVVIKLFVSIVSKKKIIEVEAMSHHTIQNIKSMIQAKEGIQSDLHTLLYAGKLLEDNRTLTSLGIKGESTLHLILDPRDILPVSVKMPTGEIVKLEVKVLYTVGDVKAIVGSMVGFLASDHSLNYDGKQLEDSKSLACYNIREDSILEMLPLLPLQIFVKDWSGKTVTLHVHQKDTVTDVKNMVVHKLGIPNNFHSLVFAGKSLEGSCRDLASYGIGKQSTIQVVFRPSTLVRPIKLNEIGKFEPAVLGSTTIQSLKKKIEKKLGKPVKEVLLRGQAMVDRLSLADYSIKLNTVMGVIF